MTTTGETVVHGAETVLRNARIYTVDASRPWAQALAIQDGRLVFVGDDQAVTAWIGPHTRIIDAGGRLVLPGFVESHWHLNTTALAYQAWVNHEDPQQVLQALRDYVDAHPDEPAITGMGWIAPLMPPDVLRKETLDAICPDRPVILFSTDMHAAWVNSRALAVAGIDRDTPPPVPGSSWFEKDPVTGEPTGVMIEPAAYAQVLEALTHAGLMPTGIDLYRRSIKAWQPRLTGAGITTLADCAFVDGSGDPTVLFRTLESLDAEGDLHMRVVGCHAVAQSVDATEVLDTLDGLRTRFQSERVRARFLKVLLDGIEVSHTAYLLEPYADRPDHTGGPMLPPDEFFTLIREADARGIDVMVHAIGDAAVRLALDAFEAALQANPPRDRRHTITHAWMTRDEDVPRFRRLGLIANTQLQWAVVDGYNGVIRERLGAARMDSLYRFRRFIEAGVTVSLGMDALACQCRCQWRPVETLESGQTRRLPGDPDAPVFGDPAQALSLPELIAGYTLNGAYQLGMEHEVGSLSVGKRADVIVLDRDLFELPPSAIAQAQVLLTLLGGRVTHDAGVIGTRQTASELGAQCVATPVNDGVPLRRWACYCQGCAPSLTGLIGPDEAQ